MLNNWVVDGGEYIKQISFELPYKIEINAVKSNQKFEGDGSWVKHLSENQI